jgi:hypothetical protein
MWLSLEATWAPALMQEDSLCILRRLTISVERCISGPCVHHLKKGGSVTLTNIVLRGATRI